MKRIFGLAVGFVTLALASSAWAQVFTPVPFGPTNLVIFRMGDGVTLTNAGSRVFLDEYYTNGVFRQSHPIPTNYFGANSPLLESGSAFGNGLISRSADGRFVVVTGYGAKLGQFAFGLQTTFNTEAPRVVGLVDGNGNVDTTTAQTNSTVSGEQLRSAASSDGTNLWFGGSGSSGGGIRYTSRGLNVSTNLSFKVTNVRQLNIFAANGFTNLYFSTAADPTSTVFVCSNDVANTLPTITNNVLESGIGVTNFYTGLGQFLPWAFSQLKLKAGGADPFDTLYIADGSNAVQKLSLVGGNWNYNGSIPSFGAVGVVAQIRVIGGVTNVDLWVTGGGTAGAGFDALEAATDASGFNGTPTVVADDHVLAGSGNLKSFRGIVFAPVGGETFPSGPAQLSVGPVLGFFASGSTGCSVAETDTYSVANLGASTLSWQAISTNWIGVSPSSGSLLAGASITVSVFGKTPDVASLLTGTNTSTIIFTNLTTGAVTARDVQIIERDQSISPTTDFVSSGQPTGPFSPLTKVYTVFNGGSPITLIVTNLNATGTWVGFNATNIPLGACSSTNITVAVVTNAANALTVGNYLSVINFSNATAGAVIDSINAQLTVGGLFFCDDFSTFTQNANLVPQQGWTGVGGTLNEPFVTNNTVAVAAEATVGGIAADEPYKNFPQIAASNHPNDSVFCAMVMTVTSAAPVATASPSRIMTFWQNQGASGFARDQMTVRDTGTGTFVFAIRINGITANAYRFGTTPLSYNTPYRVIMQGRADNTNTYVYVNPSSATLNTASAYCSTNVVGSNAADFNIGSVQFGNSFVSASFNYQAGIAISKMCVTTNYADAYNDITSAADPFTTWQSQYFGGSGNPNAAGTADPDGDGMSNTNEFLAGFNPTNTAASVRILSIAKTGNDMTVTYRGASGNATTVPPSNSRTNVLEFATGTANGSYTNANFASIGDGGTNELSGGTGLGQVATFIHTNGAVGATKYYRVRVIVP